MKFSLFYLDIHASTYSSGVSQSSTVPACLAGFKPEYIHLYCWVVGDNVLSYIAGDAL